MPNVITSQTIVDGSRNLIVKIHIDGDGSGEETGTVLLDASSYSPAFTNAKLIGIHSQLTGFVAELEWDGATNSELLIVPDYEFNLNGDQIVHFGGIPNDATTPTGDILITTVGLGANDHGSIILELKKRNNV